MSDKEVAALMTVLSEMRRTGSRELNHWADRIQDAMEEASEN